MAHDPRSIDPATRARTAAAARDPFDAFPPPLDLTSDMLLAVGSCAAEPLRRAFPGVPFAAVAGRALLGAWFARVHEIAIDVARRHDRFASVERPLDVPYHELNVAVLLRERRLFVPGIYATSELALRLGHRYGMPKKAARMSYRVGAGDAASTVGHGDAISRVRARAAGDGRALAALLSWFLPTWTWPVLFPGGGRIRARLQGVARARLVRLSEGRLELDEPWSPVPVALWPVALHLAGQRMRLPGEGR